jgi:formylglycine-generating enzyme required for sulfatase activity
VQDDAGCGDEQVLAVDWPSHERASAEAASRKGLLAFQRDGCKIRLIAECTLPGRYEYQAVSPKRDELRIRHRQELEAYLPMHGEQYASLLQSDASLQVVSHVVGRESASTIPAKPGSPGCASATHFANALYTGAYSMYSIRAKRPDGHVEILTQDGNPRECVSSRSNAPLGCSALVSFDLRPFRPAPSGPARAVIARAPAPKAHPVASKPSAPVSAVTYRSAPHSSSPAGAVRPTQPVAAPTGMVAIPPGRYRIGATDLGHSAHPVSEISLAGFVLDTHEVTMRDYQRCIDDGMCSPPSAITGVDATLCAYQQNQQRTAAGLTKGAAAMPVNCVRPDQAAAFCRYAGKRLPTDIEWEVAARGTDFRKFPWGNAEPDKQVCRRKGRACSVGANPVDRSPFGVFDLAGNLREVTAGESCTEDDSRCLQGRQVILKGGSRRFLTGLAGHHRYFRSAHRSRANARSGSLDVGFRCARSL